MKTPPTVDERRDEGKELSQHTPGQWVIATLDYRSIVTMRLLHAQGTDVPQLQTVARVTERGPVETEANARLIASAPDLLAVAKDFVGLYAGLDDAIGPSVKAKVQRARAAVAKAEAGHVD